MIFGFGGNPKMGTEAYFEFHSDGVDISNATLSKNKDPGTDNVWHTLRIRSEDGVWVELSLFGDDAEQLAKMLDTPIDEAEWDEDEA